MNKKVLILSIMAMPFLNLYAFDEYINGIYYNVNREEQCAEVTYGDNKYVGSIDIPSSIVLNGKMYPVVNIGEKAFYDCVDLKSVRIPENVVSIEGLAFCWCSNMTSIEFPNGSLQSIEWLAFGYCQNLSTISIPNTVTEIGSGAFTGCSGLSSIVLPPHLHSIDAALFEECTSLKSIDIPETTESIGYSAFGYCCNLEEIVLPATMKQIDSAAFIGCNNIKDVYCYSKTLPQTETDAFESFFITSAILHVPNVSLRKYEVSEPWRWFGSIVPMETGLEIVKTSSFPLKHYSIGGFYLNNSNHGINIIMNSDGTTQKVYIK